MAAEALRGLGTGHQGVGLIGEGENQVGLFLSGTLVGIHHGDAVKQMPGIDHERRQGCGQETCSAG